MKSLATSILMFCHWDRVRAGGPLSLFVRHVCSEIDDLMANIRRHASAPVPVWGFPVWQRPRLHSISNQISTGVVSGRPSR